MLVLALGALPDLVGGGAGDEGDDEEEDAAARIEDGSRFAHGLGGEEDERGGQHGEGAALVGAVLDRARKRG